MLRRLIPVLLLVATVSLVTPTTSAAYPASVERWRPYLHKKLVEYGVYTPAFEDRALHIMYRESGGSPTAGHRSGCYGLYQFKRGFGAELHYYAGYFDLVRKRTEYRIFRVLEQHAITRLHRLAAEATRLLISLRNQKTAIHSSAQ